MDNLIPHLNEHDRGALESYRTAQAARGAYATFESRLAARTARQIFRDEGWKRVRVRPGYFPTHELTKAGVSIRVADVPVDWGEKAINYYRRRASGWSPAWDLEITFINEFDFDGVMANAREQIAEVLEARSAPQGPTNRLNERRCRLELRLMYAGLVGDRDANQLARELQAEIREIEALQS